MRSFLNKSTCDGQPEGIPFSCKQSGDVLAFAALVFKNTLPYVSCCMSEEWEAEDTAPSVRAWGGRPHRQGLQGGAGAARAIGAWVGVRPADEAGGDGHGSVWVGVGVG